MTIINPKSIAGVTSITTPSGSDNLFTVHTNNTTERVRINNDGDVIVGSGITVSPDGDIFTTGVTTSTTFVGALTGNVTGNATGLSGTPNISAGTIAGSTGTFTGDVDIADKIIHTGDTDTLIRFPSADNIQFDVAGVERLRVDNSDGAIAKHTTSANLRIKNSTAASSQTATLDMAPANGVSGVQLKCTSEEDFSTGANRTAFFTVDVRKDGTFSERLRLDSSGHMGLGVTPNSNWPSNDDFKALQIGTGACVFGRGSGDDDRAGLAANYYATGSGNAYLANGHANLIYLNDGNIDFYTAAQNSSGAGAALTLSQILRMNTSGNIKIGNNSDRDLGGLSVQRLHIEGTDGGSSAIGLVNNQNSTGQAAIYFSKSRGTSVGSNTILQDGDPFGSLVFCGSDGTDMTPIGAQISAEVNGTPGSNDMPGRLVFKATTDGGQAPAERMRIGASGSHAEIFMNCTESFTSAMLSLQTNGTTGIGIKAGATNGQRHISFRNPNGEVGSIHTDGSSTVYYTSSDYRLKENATAISDGITRLKTLKPYRFNFKADATTILDGFFAHEVTAVPEAISGTKDEVDSDNNPVYQGIDQSKLVPLLTAALQEAVTKIEVLETRLNNAGIAT